MQAPGQEWSPGDEEAFRRWYAAVAKDRHLSPDPDDPRHFYDWRQAFKSGATADDSGHWPSTFKRFGHPHLVVDGQDTRTGSPLQQSPDILAAAMKAVALAMTQK